MDILKTLQGEFHLKPFQVENTVQLIDDGNTIPFIARYRKEATGSLDDQLLRELSDRLSYLRNLEEQRQKVKEAIEQQGKWTDEIAAALDAAATLTEIDDIYRPYRPKRKTRASVAKEKGLEPLAALIYAQDSAAEDYETAAAGFVDANGEVPDMPAALQGAMDIIAEWIADDANVRRRLRDVFMRNAVLNVTGVKEDMGVYEMYQDFSEPVRRIAGHRVLAINRGEKEEYLKVSVDFDPEKALEIVCLNHVKGNGKAAGFVRDAAADAYERLICPSIQREIRSQLTQTAAEAAIQVFGMNLKQLLMQPPVKGNTVIGLDPGYRTGCKVAVVDPTGKVLDTGVIYPAPPHNKTQQAKAIIKQLVEKYHVTMFAIGNGTASHETEVFAAEVIKELNCGISYLVVSEAGASVYSASKLAAEEFPEYDVSLRSAVSIARRLQDPLAELVKIDPKAIGVGQYQHDMPQARLSETLDGVVEDCVNAVGVDLNTASAQLLSKVAGISGTVSKNIVTYRQENGAFTKRDQLKKVPKLGPKAFEQCAGFLRVQGENVLDNTGVHPESYAAAKQLLSVCGYTAEDVKNGAVAGLAQRVEQKGVGTLAEKLSIGAPTLLDIVKELQKPGRDPRDELPKPMLRQDVMSMEDLKPGMELKGTVRNVIDFGAFVDIGVHQDGLVHISQITDRFIRHPSECLHVGDIVTVWVLSVDPAKKRISLTMKKPK